MLVQDFAGEYARYRSTAEKAMAQVSDDALNKVVYPDGNSIAMIVRHMSGNLISRFTDFLASDGEKEWRNRENEFADGTFSRADVESAWTSSWSLLETELAKLDDSDLDRTVTIRGQELTAHAALCRSLAHTAMHVGQIIILARMLATDDWKWISIPKGQSQQYNANPTLEKGPAR